MAVNDVAKLIVHLSFNQAQFRPGMHFQQAVAQPSLQTLIDAWQQFCQVPMLACMSIEVFLNAYEVQDKVPGLSASIIDPQAPFVPGVLADQSLPGQDAIVFSHKSALKSRRARGRTYWPGVTEAANTGGQLTTPGQAPWLAFVAAITTNFVGTATPTGWRLVNFSPEKLTPPKPPPVFKPRPNIVITPVTNIVLDPVIRSQRRRQVGVGQ